MWFPGREEGPSPCSRVVQYSVLIKLIRALAGDLYGSVQAMDCLPIVDMASLDREANAKAIVEAMETIGFSLVENIAGYDEESLFNAIKWFFALPPEKKMTVTRKKWNKQAKSIYRGYFPVNHDSISYKEGYEFGYEVPPDDPELVTAAPFVEHNVWPERGEGEDEEPFRRFQETITLHYKTVFSASVDYMRLLALGLGLKENFFDHMFIPSTLSTLRLLCYPPRVHPPPLVAVTEDGTVLYCSSHADTGFLTMLTSFNKPGLQILCRDNTWMDVQSQPGALVVNLGEMLSEMSGHRIKATQHRVVDTRGRRYSCPFFLEPGYFGRMPVSLSDSIENGDVTEKGGNACFTEYGLVLRQSIKRYTEYGSDWI